MSKCRGLFPLVWSIAATHIAFAADLDSVRRFDIQPQRLDSALIEFSQQSELQVIGATATVADAHTEGVSGVVRSRDALKSLLQGTSLGFDPVGAHSVRILAHPETAARGRDRELHLAEVEQAPASARAATEATVNEPTPAALAEQSSIDQVVITGSRLRQVDTQGVQQVNVYSSEQIRTSGQSTIADFLSTLPEVSTRASSIGTQMLAGQQTVQLRGLPIGTTLLLLNGRRVEGGGSAGSGAYGTTFDLNNIPAAAVERIEVVPQGSSATYGSDALAGVVNVILKKGFEGFDADVRYAGASGMRDTSANAAWGVAGARGSMTVVASYLDQGKLMGSERVISNTSDFRFIGGPDMRGQTCFPGNVFSATGGNLPGLPAPSAGIPAGISGRPSVADFASTGNSPNLCARENESALTPASRIAGAFLSGDYNLLPSVRLFAELMYSHQDQDFDLLPLTLTKQSVPASNAFNPFGQNVLVTFRFPQEYQRTYQLTTEFVRPLIGARGAFAGDWSWEASAWISRDRTRVLGQHLNIDSAALAQALASSDPATALNLFSSNAADFPAATMQALFPDSPASMSGEARTIQAFVRGPLWHLPAGDIEVALGSEYDDSSLEGHLSATSAPYRFTRSTHAVFGETRVPLVNRKRLGRISVTLASRYDRANDFGGNTTSQAGLEWRPTDALLVRGAWAQAYRAPPLYFFSATPLSLVSPLIDPKRGGEVVSVPQTAGGNSDLIPETGRSRSFGLVWSPQSLEGLQTSLTWWEVLQENRIASLRSQQILDNEDLFPDRVVRAPSVDGRPGPLLSVARNYINFGELKVAGLDGSASYRVSTAAGLFTPTLDVTNIQRYDAAIVPGAPVTSRDSRASTDAWAPRWKGTASLGWERDEWSARVSGRYVGKYVDYDGVRTLGNMWFCDVSAQYGIGQRLWAERGALSHTRVSVGLVNAFNSLPVYSAYNGGVMGWDPLQYDIRGRYAYGSIGFSW